MHPTVCVILILLLGVSSVRADWSDNLDEDDLEAHRFAIEYGLWTPDPRLLLGPAEENGKAGDGSAGAGGRSPSSLAKFVTPNNTVVTVQVGTQAAFRCQVSRMDETVTVSWIRRRDHHLITLGPQTHTSDDRFHLVHIPETQDWTLHLKFAQMRDSGTYECQLSTHPPIGIITTLRVVQPVSVIHGSPDLYVKAESDVTLICRLKNFTQPPTYVFWYHGDKMINYDSNRKISVVSQGGESVLQLTRVLREDSGNYTCVPANAKHSSITVHVIPGEAPAAMQRAGAPPRHREATLGLLLLLLATLSL